MHSLELVNQPLQRQLRGLNVALRGGSPERAREHARNAVALVNEATDLNLTCDDLLLTLAEGARFTRLPGDLRDEVRGLLGSDSSGSLGDPRWDDLLGGGEGR
jgi:hypothetical protein